MLPGITVAIPTIPPRAVLLQRALNSVLSQTRPADAISVAMDTQREGAAHTRQRALDVVRTEWVAFLDDDDEFHPDHLESLYNFAVETRADYAYSWFDTVPQGCDPFPATHFTLPWSNDRPRQTTIVTLVRTELAQDVGFAKAPDGQLIEGQRAGEDWHFTLGCVARGANIQHLKRRTWLWHHHGKNTSGMPNRW